MILVLSDVRPLLAARFGFLADSIQYPLVPMSRQARSGSGSATAVATLDDYASGPRPPPRSSPFQGEEAVCGLRAPGRHIARGRLAPLSPERGRDGVGVCGLSESSNEA